jgi:hypothetical protein
MVPSRISRDTAAPGPGSIRHTIGGAVITAGTIPDGICGPAVTTRGASDGMHGATAVSGSIQDGISRVVVATRSIYNRAFEAVAAAGGLI